MGDEDSIYALPDPRGLDAAGPQGAGKITFDTLLPSRCPAFIEAVEKGREAAPFDKNVLIHSEAGCGKHFFFHALLNESNRDDMPGLYANLAAGALPSIRVLERAKGGTLFVAGIDKASPEAQGVILRIARRGEFETPDGRSVNPDLRIICSSRLPLEELKDSRVIREDLFRHVARVRIWIPPLRERQEDIEPLLKGFLALSASRHGKPTPQCEPGAIEALKKHPFPGNVGELRSIADQLVLLGKRGRVALGGVLLHPPPRQEAGAPSAPPIPAAAGDRNLDAMIRKQVLETLAICKGNRAQTAKLLGIERTTLWKWLKKWGIDESPSQGR